MLFTRVEHRLSSKLLLMKMGLPVCGLVAAKRLF
jgi:hypothetical protein